MPTQVQTDSAPVSPGHDDPGTVLINALAAFAGDPGSSTATMRSLQKSDPGRFVYAAGQLLGSAEKSAGSKVLAGLVASDPLVVDMLLRDQQIPLAAATAAASQIIDADPLFDIRLVKGVIQDSDEVIPAPLAMRLLRILDQASDCSRLTSYLIKLSSHQSQHVRSKSVLLVGRGNHNISRARKFLSSPEPRVRANAVESLWDRPDPGTLKILVECSQDPHQRVAINALVGLCRLGDSKAPGQLVDLARSENPVARAGAAWGMGQVNRLEVVAEFRAALETLTGDSEQKVQKMARMSVEKLASFS
jgi:hypothetical protein